MLSLFIDFNNFWFKILNSIGAVALFIFGMKIMSDGAQRIAGRKLRNFINTITQKKSMAILAGIGLTTAIQSSSAVSVLAVSFTNAGLLSLYKAFSIIVGANIGTTLKLWIISLGYEFNFYSLCLPIIAVSLPFYLSKKITKQNWALFIIGFSLMFLGLNFLTQNLAFLTQKGFLAQFLTQNHPLDLLNQLNFLLLGLILTILIQSSSASTSIVLVLFNLGIPLELCASMIIGANIGTSSTAIIASFVANAQAKCVAYFHLSFNLLGGLLFFFITPILIQWLASLSLASNHFIVLVLFHTLFNLVTAIVILPFIEFFANYAERKYNSPQINNPPNDFSPKKLNLINSPLTLTSEMYIYEANKKLLRFVGNIKQSITLVGRLITESDEDKFNELHHRIVLLEREGDRLEKNILGYLNKIYGMDLPINQAKKIYHLIEVSKELESIGDLIIRMSFTHKKRRKTNSFITPKLRTNLLQLQDLVSLATTHLIQNINENNISPNLEKSLELERHTDERYRESYKLLIKSIEQNKIKPLSALLYRDLTQNYEIISDHIFKANKALTR
ncbi:Na/Pi cotransporter family protein [Ornithobacterium rhinotracheale]|uniref:Na/Pi cotransporter family protein n=1 Tax=Ornithobacterium rhinotracheale TaxID=28251 RepID=UPI00129C6DA5|nr:Na/Pi symporter [Ornithobacterium rhinotracheale]MRI62830.1 Na/Pi cotransporter family protein [Ornithobacterium rhinotracheale]MRJ09888.1 Na/Pi cotransporter family protein [Ornithobacterium rhinotracheale]